jgi:hypothetical protein
VPETTAARPPGNYGIDAPGLVAVPALLILAGVVQAVLQHTRWPLVGSPTSPSTW